MKKIILILSLVLIAVIGCKKDNSNNDNTSKNTNTPSTGLSGKYASYKEIDTVYGSFANIDTIAFLGDTLNFQSFTNGNETGINWASANPFSYSIKTHILTGHNIDGIPEEPFYIYVINSTTIEILVYDGTKNISGRNWALYYQKN
jgi:hypothetical protein